MATIASADIVLEWLNFLDITACFKIGNNSFSCFKSCHTCIFATIKNLRFILCCSARSKDFIGNSLVFCTCHMSVICESTNDREIMTKTYFKVVRVVSRSNLYNTCTLCHIRMFIAYNRNFLIKKRKNNMATVKMCISWVVTVDSYGCIAKHSFRSCCCKFKFFACFLNGVKKMPEITLFFLIFNLGIRNRSVAMRTPVYHSVATINQIFVIKANKNLTNSL